MAPLNEKRKIMAKIAVYRLDFYGWNLGDVIDERKKLVEYTVKQLKNCLQCIKKEVKNAKI